MNLAAYFNFAGWIDAIERDLRAQWRVLGLLVLAAVLPLVLGACSTPSPAVQPLQATAPAARPIVVGTLATNACELQTAATYTAAITAVQVTRARLRSGQVPIATAREIEQLGRAAVDDLDAACPNKTLDAERLARAQRAVARMQTLLGG